MEFVAPVLSALTIIAVVALLLKKPAGDGGAAELRDRLTALSAQLAQVNSDRAAQESNLRRELNAQLTAMADSQSRKLNEIASNYAAQQDKLNLTVTSALKEIQDTNTQKLEQMRVTVDEKLESTLGTRLDSSFKTVSEQLERLYESFGKMQELGEGVSGLTRVLTNVKTRGTWGEIQLKSILEQILTPDQYGENVKPAPRSNAIVEFAVKLPGRDDGETVWLPVDSKFPQEDYVRLTEAADRADEEGLRVAQTALYNRIKGEARDISTKYIHPPETTDFAILFIPTEPIYAEVLRNSALIEECQDKYRVVIAGPTTFAALLNSLRMGFRTLAIEKKSSEVWKLLSAIKTQYAALNTLVEKSMKKLDEAHSSMSDVQNRSNVINRRLSKVGELTPAESAAVLSLEDGTAETE